ncbi:MAG: hypothetical protein EPO65_11075 [Dehalococcoidia bacterium]|nr:MAG: hypothetical protein EPO65_11075 [Dehalococcoidia bacterium]
MFVMQRGTLLSFSATTYTASVLLMPSTSTALEAVPVSRGIASGEMVVGRQVSVALFDGVNPDDAMVVGVW